MKHLKKILSIGALVSTFTLLAVLNHTGVFAASITPFSTTGNNPNDIIIDSVGNLYTANVSDDTITKITPAGVSTTFATTGDQPNNIAIDSSDNIYSVNYLDGDITKVTPAGSTSTFGSIGAFPFAITIDSSDNVYTTHLGSNNVYKTTSAGVSTILGTTGTFPQSIALDSSGNIYTANWSSDNVSKITPAGVSTTLGTTGDQPNSIVVDGSGNVYVTNSLDNNITQITPAGVSTIFATTGTNPSGITMDSSGNFYTANYGSNNISKITPAGVSTIVDITGSNPFSLVFDATENMYVANYGANTVTKLTSPFVTEVTPVSTPTADTTPNYTFNTDVAGTISYGGSCSSGTTSATAGDNTITFTSLSEGTYSDCTITVTAGGNSDTVNVTTFTVDVPEPSTGSCSSATTSGNVFGVIDTELVGPIYVSTDSWNQDPGNASNQTSDTFFVEYDRSIGVWRGRGWNEVFGWVDFGYTTPANTGLKIMEFESIKDDNENNGGAAWGGLSHQADLSGVVYVTDNGTFQGTAYHGGYTGGGGEDEIVGAGDITFDNLQYFENPDCNEYVDITLNNANTLYQSSCPIPHPTIRWTSENVSNCETDTGEWDVPGSRSANNTIGEASDDDITAANTPVIFRLRCEGDESGATIFGTAYASCGDASPGTGNINPTSNIVIPQYQEV